MIGAERKSEVELREIHGDEVIERSRFDRIALADGALSPRAGVSRIACG